MIFTKTKEELTVCQNYQNFKKSKTKYSLINCLIEPKKENCFIVAKNFLPC